MAKNVMNRRFTTREKILMLILVCVLFIGLYFLLVFFPIRNQLDDIQAQRDEIDFNMTVQRARESIYDSMVKEINSTEHLTVMPEYNNYVNLMNEFENIFANLEPTVDSSRVTKNDNVWSRVFVISFRIENFYLTQTETETVDEESGDNTDEEQKPTITDYKKAKEILLKLTKIPYVENDTDGNGSDSETKPIQYCRCLINNLSISPSEGDLENDTLTVSCTITYYEIDPQ